MNLTPSAFKKRLDARRLIIGEMIAGLEGRTFHWGGGEFTSRKHILKELGITLVTKTSIQKRGLELRRGAKPVGSCYFSSPISRAADVYILECQTVPKTGKS